MASWFVLVSYCSQGCCFRPSCVLYVFSLSARNLCLKMLHVRTKATVGQWAGTSWFPYFSSIFYSLQYHIQQWQVICLSGGVDRPPDRSLSLSLVTLSLPEHMWYWNEKIYDGNSKKNNKKTPPTKQNWPWQVHRPVILLQDWWRYVRKQTSCWENGYRK